MSQPFHSQKYQIKKKNTTFINKNKTQSLSRSFKIDCQLWVIKTLKSLSSEELQTRNAEVERNDFRIQQFLQTHYILTTVTHKVL